MANCHIFNRISFFCIQLPLLDGLESFWQRQITFAISDVSARRTRHSFWSSQRLRYRASGCCYNVSLATAPLSHVTVLRHKWSVPPSFGRWWRSHHWPGPAGSTPAAASAAHSSYLYHVHWCWKLQRRNNPLGKRPETKELLGIVIHLCFSHSTWQDPYRVSFPRLMCIFLIEF